MNQRFRKTTASILAALVLAGAGTGTAVVLPMETTIVSAAETANGMEYQVNKDGTVTSTAFSVEEDGDCYLVTLRAECEEQIGKTVEFAQ